MRKYPSNIEANTLVSVVRDIAASRAEDIREYESLRDTKLGGRHRTTVRSAPIDAEDVVSGDLLGDEICDNTYRYKLIQTPSGSYYWHRETLNISVPWS